MAEDINKHHSRNIESNMEKKYKLMLQKEPRKLKEELLSSIREGYEDHAISIMNILEQLNCPAIIKAIYFQGNSLLHIAVSHKRNKVFKKIVELFPDFMYVPPKGDYKAGQNILHIAALHGNTGAVDIIKETCKRECNHDGTSSCNEQCMFQQLLAGDMYAHLDEDTGISKTWSYIKTIMCLKCDTLNGLQKYGENLYKQIRDFEGTVMMGGLPLFVAVLSLDDVMVEELLECGADVYQRNIFGDTVFHSLIKYVASSPQDFDSVKKMIDCLNNRICETSPKLKRKRSTQETTTEETKEKVKNANFSDINVETTKSDENNKSNMMMNLRAIWFAENNDGHTPLRLAAKKGQVEIFHTILEKDLRIKHISSLDETFPDESSPDEITLDGLYCRLLDDHDGVHERYQYDVTEFDSVAQEINKEEIKNQRYSKTSQDASINRDRNDQLAKNAMYASTQSLSVQQESRKSSGYEKLKFLLLPCNSKSVLHTVSHNSGKNACVFVQEPLVREIIYQKWKSLRIRLAFALWLIIHLSAMVLLTFFAVFKRHILNEESGFSGQNQGSSNQSSTSINSAAIATSSSKKTFVAVVKFFALFYGLFYLYLEGIRYWYLKQRLHLDLFHHNGLYRLTLVIFSVFLVIDFFWYEFKPHPDNNYFLVVSLIFGGWFLTFFCRIVRQFSFFTLMIQKVFFGDMIRFFFLILIELISFSIAMHVTFLDREREHSEFRDVPKTILTMFKVMLGLTDIEILLEAKDPWLSVTLYTTFILITYILLINALIAMMSQTCANVSDNRDVQNELQKLSVTLLIESMIPRILNSPMGIKVTTSKRVNIESGTEINETRFLYSVLTKSSQARKVICEEFRRTRSFRQLSARDSMRITKKRPMEDKEVNTMESFLSGAAMIRQKPSQQTEMVPVYTVSDVARRPFIPIQHQGILSASGSYMYLYDDQSAQESDMREAHETPIPQQHRLDINSLDSEHARPRESSGAPLSPHHCLDISNLDSEQSTPREYATPVNPSLGATHLSGIHRRVDSMPLHFEGPASRRGTKSKHQ